MSLISFFSSLGGFVPFQRSNYLCSSSSRSEEGEDTMSDQTPWTLSCCGRLVFDEIAEETAFRILLLCDYLAPGEMFLSQSVCSSWSVSRAHITHIQLSAGSTRTFPQPVFCAVWTSSKPPAHHRIWQSLYSQPRRCWIHPWTTRAPIHHGH